MTKKEKVEVMSLEEATPICEIEQPRSGQATAEQIDTWRKLHSEVLEYSCDGKVCYLRRPTRKVLGLASVSSAGDPIAYNEVVINNCWLGGDDDLRLKDEYFLGLSGYASELVAIKSGELKKL